MTDDDPRYEVEHPEIKAILREIGLTLGKNLPKGWGFCLQLFEFNEGAGGSFFYISNAQRAHMLKALQEFIDREIKVQ